MRFHAPALLSSILIAAALQTGCDPASAPEGEEPAPSPTCASGEERVSAPQLDPACRRGTPNVRDHLGKPVVVEQPPTEVGSLDGSGSGDPPCPGAVPVGREMGPWQCSGTGVWSRLESQDWLCADGQRKALRHEERSLFACVP